MRIGMALRVAFNRVTKGWSADFTGRYRLHREYLRTDGRSGQRFEFHDGDALPKRLVGVDLRKADLSGAPLAGADLSRSDLREATMDGANLTNSVLYSARATGVSLKRANLEGANLDCAAVCDARFDGAVLVNANMSYTNVRKATFDGANLTRASAARAIGLVREQIDACVSIEGARLPAALSQPDAATGLVSVPAAP